MDKAQKRKPDRLLWLWLMLLYIGVFAASVFGEETLSERQSVSLLAGVVLLAMAWFVWRFLTNQWNTWRDLLVLALVLGCALRIACMLHVDCFSMQHDTQAMSLEDDGHYTYILSLLLNHTLPPMDNQGYHPPFYHFCAALTLAAVEALAPFVQTVGAPLLHVQIVSCFASCATLVLTPCLARQMGLEERGTMIATGIVAVQPTMALFMAESGNNDSLLWFLCALSLYYLLRWWHTPTLGRILWLALALGLAIMTKVSAGLLAVPIAFVFLCYFIQSVRRGRAARAVGQFAGFAALVFPLGLWHPIWKWLVYGLPFFYVYPLGKDNWMYTGNYTLWQRFGLPEAGAFFSSPYVYLGAETAYNLPDTMIKSAAFGEYVHDLAVPLAWVALVLNTLVMLAGFVAMLWVLLRGRTLEPVARFVFPGLYLLQLGMYVWFYAQYPYSCTMDARYLVLNILLGALLLGAAVDGWYHSGQAGKAKREGKVLFRAGGAQ